VKAAAENGNRAVFDLIFSAKSIQEDQEELEEAVGSALKVAAGEPVLTKGCRNHSSQNTMHQVLYTQLE
jgi:hypothetical protein